MSNDIVKQIILKFKSDTKSIEADVKKIGDAFNKLDKGSQGGAVNKLAKSFQDMEKSAQRVGVTLNKDFTKIQKIVKDLATKDLQQIGKQTEQLAVKAERRLRRMQEMEQRGVSGTRMERAKTLAGATSDKLQANMDLFGQRAAGMGPPGGGGGGIMSAAVGAGGGGIGKMISGAISAAAIASIAQAPQEIAKYITERMATGTQNRAIASNFAVQQRIAGYRSDITMGAMAQVGGVARAKRQSNIQSGINKAGDYTTGALGIAGGAAIGVGGALAGAQGGAMLGAFTGPAAPIAVPVLAGLGALAGAYGGMKFGAYASKGAVDRIFNNKTEAEKTQIFQSELEKEKMSSIMPHLADQFMGSAKSRARLQQEFGITSDRAFALRQTGFGNMMEPEEQAALMRQFKPVVGAGAAGAMANTAAAQGLNQNMSTGSAAGILSDLAMGGKGGTNAAQKNMEEMFGRAVEAGVTDAGIREALEQVVAEIAKTSPSRGDTSTMMGNLLRYLPEQQGAVDPRAMSAAVSARALGEEIYGGVSPLDKAMQRSGIRGVVRGITGMKPLTKANEDFIASLPEDMGQWPLEELQRMGFSKDDLKKIHDQKKTVLQYSAPEKKILSQIQGYAKRGETVPTNLLEEYSRTFLDVRKGGDSFKNTTSETRMALAVADLKEQVPDVKLGVQTAAGAAAALTTDDKLKKRMEMVSQITGMRSDSPEVMQLARESVGAKTEDKDVKTYVADHIKEIHKKQDAVDNAYKGAGEGAPNETTKKAMVALDSFADALEGLSKTITRGVVQGKFTPKSQ